MNKNRSTIEIYEKIAEKYAATFDNDGSDDIYLEEFTALLPENSKVLDLGCGTGRFTYKLHKKGFEIIGIDFSKEMLAIAKAKYPEISFVHKDIREIESMFKEYNGILLAYTLFHFDDNDGEKIIEIVSKTLKKNGKLFLVIQEGEGEVFMEEPLLPSEDMYLNLYTEDKIKSLLEKYGFKIIFIDKKEPKLEEEWPFNKLVIIAERV